MSRALRVASRGIRRLALAACLAATSACGPDEPAPEPGPYVGQEIWITYDSPEHRAFGRRPGRTREEARTLVEELRRRVLAGEDVGPIARQHSNAPGGAALGFSSWHGRPGDPHDVRDEAFARTPIGGVTEIEDWLGGYWFAKRVPPERGRYLESIFEHLRRLEFQLRIVPVFWKGMWGLKEEDYVPRTRPQALERAQEALRLVQGGIPFAEVAAKYSDDKAVAARGGLLEVLRGGTATTWIHVGEDWLAAPLLWAAMETPVGAVHPAVVQTERGMYVLMLEAKREREPER